MGFFDNIEQYTRSRATPREDFGDDFEHIDLPIDVSAAMVSNHPAAFKAEPEPPYGSWWLARRRELKRAV